MSHTTIRVSRETHSKLDEAKPYDSLTFDEFLEEMIEDYSARGRKLKSDT